MARPTYAEVNLDTIRDNVRTLRSLLAPGTRVLGVVKADAYGHGAVEVSRTLEAAGVAMLGVALVEEGIALRVAGLRAPILVMGVLPNDEMAAAMEYGLAVTVDRLETAQEIERQAADQDRVADVHLKIDTGMNRLGVRAEDAAETAAALGRMPHLAVRGAYTHFACADVEPDPASAGQLQRFRAALETMRAAGTLPPLIHAANSSALLTLPEAHFDMVRSGLAVYGVRPCPAAAGVPLRPALALKSRVVHLKRVRRGEGVSYGHRWHAPRESVIGVLPIGYADGYPRAMWQGGQVRAAGRLVPVTGAVCMDAAMVDLTDLDAPQTGLEVTLIEADNDSPISAGAVARLAGTIPYEILTGLGKRLPRVYRPASA